MSQVRCPISGLTYTLEFNLTRAQQLIHPAILQATQDQLIKLAPTYIRGALPSRESHLWLCGLLRSTGLVRFRSPLPASSYTRESLPAVLTLVLTLRSFPHDTLPELPTLYVDYTPELGKYSAALTGWTDSCQEILAAARLSSRQSRIADLAALRTSKLDRALARILSYQSGRPSQILRGIHAWLASTLEDWPTEESGESAVASSWRYHILNLSQPDSWIYTNLSTHTLAVISEFITLQASDISAKPIQYILRALSSAIQRHEKYLGLGGYKILESAPVSAANITSSVPAVAPDPAAYPDKLSYLIALNTFRKSQNK